MLIEQNCRPLNARGSDNKDTVINISIKDENGRIIPLSTNQIGIENPVPSVDTSISPTEKKELSTYFPEKSFSKEDTVIDISFKDRDDRIVRLTNNLS